MADIIKKRRIFSVKEECCELMYCCIELPEFAEDSNMSENKSCKTKKMNFKQEEKKAKYKRTKAAEKTDKKQVNAYTIINAEKKACSSKKENSDAQKKLRATEEKKEVKQAIKQNKIDKYSLFNAYYKKIADCAEAWAREYAEVKIKNDYNTLSRHEQKFSFRRYIYRVDFETKYISDTKMRITCYFRLSHSGKAVFEKTKTDIWNTEHYLICPERKIILKNSPVKEAAKVF